MRSPQEIKSVVEARLKKYISRDRTGIRRAMLRLFLRLKSLTIAQIFEELNKRFVISYHSVAAMVGIVASRLGILHVIREKDGTCSIYQLKEQYVEMVRGAVAG